MRIAIAGGSGFLGSTLVERLAGDGHDVVVLSRRPTGDGQVAWNPDDPSGVSAVLEGADAVVNLAGESIAGARWSPERKRRIRTSRIHPTRSLVEAIRAMPTPPAVFLSASAVGCYGDRGDERLTERSAPGTDFLADVSREWEAAALDAAGATRVVLIRTGVVLDREEGALPQMALPFRLFAGGPLGSGQQYVSWIHRHDWTSLAAWTLTAGVAGPVNATAPEPVRNAEFARAIGRALGRPSFLPAPAFALRLLLGEMADALLLGGQRAIPEHALGLGFTFRFPTIDVALADIYPG